MMQHTLRRAPPMHMKLKGYFSWEIDSSRRIYEEKSTYHAMITSLEQLTHLLDRAGNPREYHTQRVMQRQLQQLEDLRWHNLQHYVLRRY
eukprot:1250112-Pyramimonas_sp.AAC.1